MFNIIDSSDMTYLKHCDGIIWSCKKEEARIFKSLEKAQWHIEKLGLCFISKPIIIKV